MSLITDCCMWLVRFWTAAVRLLELTSCMKQNRQQNAKYKNSLSILFFNQCLRDYQPSSKFCIFSSFPKSFLIVGSSDCSDSYLNYSWGWFRWNLSGFRSRTRAVSCNMDKNRRRSRKKSLLNKLVSFKISKRKIAFFFFFLYLYQMQGGEVVQQQHCLKHSWPSLRRNSSEDSPTRTLCSNMDIPLWTILEYRPNLCDLTKSHHKAAWLQATTSYSSIFDLGSIHCTLQKKIKKISGTFSARRKHRF